MDYRMFLKPNNKRLGSSGCSVALNLVCILSFHAHCKFLWVQGNRHVSCKVA